MKLNSLNIFAASFLIIGANAAVPTSIEDTLIWAPLAYYTCSVKAMDGDVVRGEAVYQLDKPVDLTGYNVYERIFQVRRSGMSKCNSKAPSIETLIQKCQAKAQEQFPGASHVITGMRTKFGQMNIPIKVIRDPDFIQLNDEQSINIILNQMN